VVIWLDDNGKSGLQNDDVKKLVAAGSAVVGADLFFQDGEPVKETRVVANPREFAGYTHGYNHALFAQRVHDVLSLVTFLRNTKVGSHPNPKTVCLAAFGPQTGPIATAALSMLPGAIDRAAIDTHGFRFGKVLNYRDPMFLPGGSKYLDLPGFLKLAGPCALWLKGEGKEPEVGAVEFLNQ
jgi:hypothetical protein